MGKTLLSVLEVGAVVGAQFIPGVGTALAVTIGGTVIGGAAVATAAVVVAEAVLNATLLAPRSPKPPQTEGAIKQPLPARMSGYGTLHGTGHYIL